MHVFMFYTSHKRNSLYDMTDSMHSDAHKWLQILYQ